MTEGKKKAARQGGRGFRRPEEDIPSATYELDMEALGPRDGESHLAFRKRLAAILEARRLMVQAWRRYKGSRTEVAKFLGITPGNVYTEMRRAGLTAALLNSMMED